MFMHQYFCFRQALCVQSGHDLFSRCLSLPRVCRWEDEESTVAELRRVLRFEASRFYLPVCASCCRSSLRLMSRTLLPRFQSLRWWWWWWWATQALLAAAAADLHPPSQHSATVPSPSTAILISLLSVCMSASITHALFHFAYYKTDTDRRTDTDSRTQAGTDKDIRCSRSASE